MTSISPLSGPSPTLLDGAAASAGARGGFAELLGAELGVDAGAQDTANTQEESPLDPVTEQPTPPVVSLPAEVIARLLTSGLPPSLPDSATTVGTATLVAAAQLEPDGPEARPPLVAERLTTALDDAARTYDALSAFAVPDQFPHALATDAPTAAMASSGAVTPTADRSELASQMAAPADANAVSAPILSATPAELAPVPEVFTAPVGAQRTTTADRQSSPVVLTDPGVVEAQPFPASAPTDSIGVPEDQAGSVPGGSIASGAEASAFPRASSASGAVAPLADDVPLAPRGGFPAVDMSASAARSTAGDLDAANGQFATGGSTPSIAPPFPDEPPAGLTDVAPKPTVTTSTLAPEQPEPVILTSVPETMTSRDTPSDTSGLVPMPVNAAPGVSVSALLSAPALSTAVPARDIPDLTAQMARAGGGHVTLVLTPEGLGTIRVTVSVVADGVAVRLQGSKDAISAVGRGAVENALVAAGMTVARVEATTVSTLTDRPADQPADHRGRDGESRTRDQSRETESDGSAPGNGRQPQDDEDNYFLNRFWA